MQPTDRFRAGDRFAYSVRLTAAPGVDTVLVEIIRLGGATETVAQPPQEQGVEPTSPLIAFELHANDLLDAWGPGKYVMRIYLAGVPDPIATGNFTLVETPVAS